MGEHRLPRQPPQLNIRIRPLSNEENKGQPTLMGAVPVPGPEPGQTSIRMLPVVLEVMTVDAMSLRTQWNTVPVALEIPDEKPLIDTESKIKLQ